MSIAPYDFQLGCVEKLTKDPVRWPNSLIADDMGLGKTVEAILLDNRRREKSSWPARTLVVCPTSVTESWKRHYKTWAPTRRVIVMDRKNRAPFMKAVKEGTHDVYIMHWEAVRLEVEGLCAVSWLHVILDEAHRMKNRKAQVTVALGKIGLRTKFKTLCTGTPADDKPQDLWALLHFLYPRIWTSYWKYFNYHVVFRVHTPAPCAVPGCFVSHKTQFREIIGLHGADELHAQMAPFYVRRRKEEVLKSLPEKYYSQIEVDLEPKQRTAYDQMAQAMLAWIGEHEDEPLAAPVVVAQLLRLQQFAVAYGALVPKEVGSWSTVPYSRWEQFHQNHPDVRFRERNGLIEIYTTKVRKQLLLTEPSSKLDAVMDRLESLGSKSLVVFSQSKQLMEMFRTRLLKAGISHGIYTGDTPTSDRDDIVDKFQAKKIQVFGGTIKAGGEGITLTAADTMIFVDRDWNPSKNRQAEDREHRIGQKNAVHIIDIMAKNTIDLGRHQRIWNKWDMIKKLLGDPEEVRKQLEQGAIQ